MSNHPYGLRGDPFAPPATLSAKDASRLIRRRVRAFNGDGGALFPIETSDLIHELAGGVPDAILDLAGKAMRVAAAEGAPAVSPAHVRGASVMTPDVSSEEPATTAVAAAPQAPPDLEAARAVQAIDALIEAAEGAVRDEPTLLPYHDLPAGEAQAIDAGPDGNDGAVATSDAGEGQLDASFEDDDLPPFIPASIALPSQPSENLDPGAREWVSRFIATSGSGPVAGAVVTPHAHTPHEGTPVTTSPQAARPAPATAGPRSMPAGARATPGPRRRPRPPAPRKRRRSGNQGVLIAVAAVCIIVFVVRMSVRGNLAPPGAGPARPTPTSAPMVEPTASAPRPAASEPAHTVAPARKSAEVREPATAVRPPERKEIVPAPSLPSGPAPPRTASTPTSTSGTHALVEPARRAAPAPTFGLEVATFIFEERARVERERLAAVGLRARVITTLEYGSRVYRVVLGGFPDPAAAERAADSLLLNGVVLQARVIKVSSEP